MVDCAAESGWYERGCGGGRVVRGVAPVKNKDIVECQCLHTNSALLFTTQKARFTLFEILVTNVSASYKNPLHTILTVCPLDG